MDEQLQLQLLVHGPFLVGFYHYVFKFMTCTSGCNYNLCNYSLVIVQPDAQILFNVFIYL